MNLSNLDRTALALLSQSQRPLCVMLPPTAAWVILRLIQGAVKSHHPLADQLLQISLFLQEQLAQSPQLQKLLSLSGSESGSEFVLEVE